MVYSADNYHARAGAEPKTVLGPVTIDETCGCAWCGHQVAVGLVEYAYNDPEKSDCVRRSLECFANACMSMARCCSLLNMHPYSKYTTVHMTTPLLEARPTDLAQSIGNEQL